MTTSVVRRIGVGDTVISEPARKGVNAVLESGRLTYGPYCREFEARFAEMHDRRFGCFMNSGTDALRIGLLAMKERYRWDEGDEVLVPALTFVASVNAVLQAGLRPVLVDVDPMHFEIDPAIAWPIRRTPPRTVAVMPVHLFGQPADRAVLARAEAERLFVIDDSCETMFVPGCAEGQVSCFSTYACHILSTGVGGIALTDDSDTAGLIRSLANHGRSGIYTDMDAPLGQREVIDARFLFERSGYSSRPTEMQAAIGVAELDAWWPSLLARRRNARALTYALRDLPVQRPSERVRGVHAWMMYPLRTASESVRDKLVEHLERWNVETRPLLPLVTQPWAREVFGDRVAENHPIARDASLTGFYIGCHAQLGADDVDYIAAAFHSFADW